MSKRRDPKRARARSSSDFRGQRLEQLIFDELRFILRDEANHPGLDGVVLLHMDLARDGNHARVAYAATARPGEEDASVVERRTREALEASGSFLRARLANSLALKRVPRLGFSFVGVAPAQEEGGAPCLD